MDSPKAAGQTAGPSSSMGMFGSSHPTPALPSPSQPQKQAADPFGADPFGGVGPQEATAAPRTSGGTHPQQATSPFAATPAASGFAGQDPFGMSSFGGTESGLTGLGSGFEESAFAAPLQPGKRFFLSFDALWLNKRPERNSLHVDTTMWGSSDCFQMTLSHRFPAAAIVWTAGRLMNCPPGCMS